MHSVFAALQDLLFPPLCQGCNRRLDSSRPPLLCAACTAELTFLGSPCCSCCGLPYVAGKDHLCGECLAGPSAFDLARSLFLYQPPVSGLILALKFGGELSGIATLRALLVQSPLGNLFAEPDLIIPVPLHSSRLRQRGFNQAQVIARGCFPHWKNKIASSLLLRHRLTAPQSRLSGKERRRSLRQAFALKDPDKVRGKKILLVDDVFTTGSTVRECSKVLRRADPLRIEVFTVARSLTL